MLTIILPVYNEKKYITKCLKSIFNQSFKKWKLIIIDDASSDGTNLVIKNFLINVNKKKYKLLRNKKNLGITKSLNKALKLVDTEFIGRADADDIYKKNRFKLQIDFLKKNKNIDVLGTNAFIIDKNDKILSKKKMPTSFDELKKSLAFRNIFFHSSVVFRKSFILKNGLYNDKYINAQDYELWLRGIEDNNFANLSKFLVFYRSELNKISFSKIRCAFLIRIKYINFNKDYLKNIYSLFYNLFVDIYKLLKAKLL